MGHSAYEVLYHMNKSMEESVNNEDTFVVTAAVLYQCIVLLVLKTFHIIVRRSIVLRRPLWLTDDPSSHAKKFYDCTIIVII